MSTDIKWSEGDIVVGSAGDLTMVVDLDKLYQDLQKAVLTTIGSNKYHIDYGCAIGESTIGQGLPDWAITNDATATLQQTITHLKELQSQQRLYQTVTPSELIYTISDISTSRDTTDTRQVNITVSVISEALSTTTANLTINP